MMSRSKSGPDKRESLDDVSIIIQASMQKRESQQKDCPVGDPFDSYTGAPGIRVSEVGVEPPAFRFEIET